MRLRALTLVILLLSSGAVHAGDPPPEPRYADKPASWWVDEALTGETPGAAREILQTMGPDVVPVIAARLPDVRAWRDRLALLRVISKMRGVDARALPAVEFALRSSERDEIVEALRIATSLRESAAPLHEQIATHADAEHGDVRRMALAALSATGVVTQRLVDVLIARLDDSDARVRTQVLRSLAAAGRAASSAQPPLAEIVRAEIVRGVVVSRDAILALAAVGGAEDGTGETLVAALRSGLIAPDEIARTCAAMPEEAACLVEVGRGLLDHAAPEVRGAAARLLGRAAEKDERAFAAVLPLLGDADKSVVAAASAGLSKAPGRLATDLPRVIVAWRASPHPQVFSGLLRATLPGSGPALLEALLADDDGVRETARHILMRTRGTNVAVDPARLTRSLFDEAAPVEYRVGLVHVLVLQGLSARDEVRGALAAVVAEGPYEMALLATPALAGDGEHVSALLAATRRKVTFLRTAAIDALAPLVLAQTPAADTARDGLAALLRDAEITVAHAAFRALSRAAVTPGAEPAPWHTRLVGALAGFVRSDVPDIRTTALGALRSLPPAQRPADALLAALDVVLADLFVPNLVAESPGVSDGDLIARIDGDSPVIALRAAIAWAHRKGDAERILPRITASLEADDPDEQRAAVIALAGLDPVHWLPRGGVLVRVALGGTPHAARVACGMLSRLAEDSPSARAALLRVAADPESPAHASIAASLPGLGAEGYAALAKLLDSPVRDACRNALVQWWYVAEHGSQHVEVVVPRLREMIDGDDLELADLARGVLARMPQER